MGHTRDQSSATLSPVVWMVRSTVGLTFQPLTLAERSPSGGSPLHQCHLVLPACSTFSVHKSVSPSTWWSMTPSNSLPGGASLTKPTQNVGSIEYTYLFLHGTPTPRRNQVLMELLPLSVRSPVFLILPIPDTANTSSSLLSLLTKDAS